MTQAQTPQPSPFDGARINDLLAAAAVALRSAIKIDLPPITRLMPSPGLAMDLPQDAKRDLYAANRLYGVRFGEMCALTRRPEIEDTETLIIPQGDAYVIIVLSVSGDAAIYAPNGRGATLVRKISCVTREILDGWARASTRQPALIAP